MSELPIACTLSPSELQERRDGLLPGLLARAVERYPVSDGYRWRFEPVENLLAAISSVIDLERRCCRFLRFVVAAEPNGGPILLEVTGPPGTREFLDQLVAGAAA
jgi:hypothetical protein